MATTNFVDQATVIEAEWLNDVDEAVYGLPNRALHTTSVNPTSGTITLFSSYDRLQYTRIGNLVHVSGKLIVENNFSGTGPVSISLPYTVGSSELFTDQTYIPCVIIGESANAHKQWFFYIQEGLPSAFIYAKDSANATQTGEANLLTANTQIHVDITYIAESV